MLILDLNFAREGEVEEEEGAIKSKITRVTVGLMELGAIGVEHGTILYLVTALKPLLKTKWVALPTNAPMPKPNPKQGNNNKPKQVLRSLLTQVSNLIPTPCSIQHLLTPKFLTDTILGSEWNGTVLIV